MSKKIITIIIILVIGIGIYTFAKNSPLIDILNPFDPEGRYDATKLDYMDVIYENRSDITAFNDGYSESDNCPWGFVHNGIDYFMKNGSTVVAAAPGQVESIEVSDNGANVTNRFYVTVVIRFNQSVVIHYNFEPWTQDENKRNQQVDMLNVQVGDWVDLGDKIAEFLSEDQSAHIHFGVIINEEWQCPKQFFSEDAYIEIMEMIHIFHPDWDLCYP